MAPKKSGGHKKGLTGKKKGPKGKKARAKAKLDRQWGEQPHLADGGDEPRGRRTGSGSEHRRIRGRNQTVQSGGPSASASSFSNSAPDVLDEGDRHHHGRSYENPENLHRRRGSTTRSQDYVPYSSDDDDEGEEDEEEEGDGLEEESAGSRLLQSLRKHYREKKRQNKNHGRQKIEHAINEGGHGSSSETEEDREDGERSVGRGNGEDDGESDDDAVDDEAGGLDWDPFQERFVDAKPLPERDDERRDWLDLRLGSVETVHPASAADDRSLVVQASSALLDRLRIRRDGAAAAAVHGAGNGESEENERADAKTSNAANPSFDGQCRSLTRSFFRSIRPVLQSNWQRLYSDRTNFKDRKDSQSNMRNQGLGSIPRSSSLLFPFLARYADALVLNEATRNLRRSNLEMVAVHLLNHVLRTQEVIRRHNHQLRHKTDNPEDNDDCDVDDPPRDQGFTRPSVLVLLPTRSGCHELVRLLRCLLMAQSHESSRLQEGQQRLKLSEASDPDGMERFEAEYGPPQQLPDSTSQALNGDSNGGGRRDTKLAQRRRQQILSQKGSDWLELFGDDVNDDDDFKLGLAIHKAAGGSKSRSNKGMSKDELGIKLFADFYRSDIIIASPLGLKILLENKDGGVDTEEDDDTHTEHGEQRRGSRDTQRGYDFLSSVEICYISRADVLLMQNWDHVSDVIRLLNEQPKCSTAVDYSRVRPYHLLAGQSQHWRQLIVTSSFTDPLILSLFKRHAKSLAGSVRVRRKTLDTSEASIARVLLPTRQVFQRIPTQSLSDHASDRVRYFCDSVLPEVTRQNQKHTLVFIPSYFDFVSVRNVMLKREIDFVSVTEYSRISEVSRGRARFLQGRTPIMLYTGRAHFFHRHTIKGVRHLIFLGLPEYAEFYPGMVNSFDDELITGGDAVTSSHEASSLVLFTKYEGHALERIVGGQNCTRMLHGEKSTFLF
jgi:U3 small nucleolar RNA-associated protein 25